MKFTVLLSAALMAGMFPLQATTQGVAPGTNANPEAAMTALFGNPAVVKGKGFEIKRGDLDQVVSAAKANLAVANTPAPADLEISVLDQLITIQVLLQTATPADQAAGQIDADQQYTNLLAQFRSPEDFARLLKARGLTVEDLRAKALQEAIAKAALKRALNINPTDEDAAEYYKQHAADFEQPEMVHARHILLTTVDLSTRPPTALTTNTIAAKRRLIEDLRKRILAGEDFATLAKQYSEDGSKENGGELPQFARGQMVPEFESAAFSLATNQVSDVVTSQFGFHLIKVMEKIPAQKIAFAKAEHDIKEVLTQLKIRKLAPDYIKKLRTDEQVEIQDADLKSQDEQTLASQAAAAAAAAAAAQKTNGTDKF
jgi:parvulin-like peptidyl-prolyl isomerase